MPTQHKLSILSKDQLLVMLDDIKPADIFVGIEHSLRSDIKIMTFFHAIILFTAVTGRHVWEVEF